MAIIPSGEGRGTGRVTRKSRRFQNDKFSNYRVGTQTCQRKNSLESVKGKTYHAGDQEIAVKEEERAKKKTKG